MELLVLASSGYSCKQDLDPPFWDLYEGSRRGAFIVRPQTSSDIIRFMRPLVAKRSKDECWDWKGPKNKAGYGVVSIYQENRRYIKTASRVVLALKLGRWPKIFELACHRCDTPSCVNPHHIYGGTHKNNSDDKMRRGRFIKTFKKNHKIRTTNIKDHVAADILNLYYGPQGGGTLIRRIREHPHGTKSEIMKRFGLKTHQFDNWIMRRKDTASFDMQQINSARHIWFEDPGIGRNCKPGYLIANWTTVSLAKKFNIPRYAICDLCKGKTFTYIYRELGIPVPYTSDRSRSYRKGWRDDGIIGSAD